MSLQVEIDSWDYDQAVKAVQKILDDIDVETVDPDVKTKILNMPSGAEIVDLVWDCIK